MEAATVRAAPARAPRSRPAPARAPRTRPAPRRKPARRKAPARHAGGQLIPIAVGTASAVRRLPDSSLMVRMTQGRAWIAVLGLLLAGIVTLNVVTLSLTATAGTVEQNIAALDRENSMLRARDAQKSGAARIRSDAAAIGLTVASSDDIKVVESSPRDVQIAAQRLAAAGSGY
jgi:hypothetical protein